MMVKSVSLGIIDSSHVDNNIELVEDRLLPCAHYDGICKLACLQQHDGGKDFVAVKRIGVCPDELLGRLGLDLIEFFHFLGTHDNKIICDAALVLKVFGQVRYLGH